MDHRETTLPAGAMLKILRELKNREKDMVRLLGDFVRCESPSHNKAAVDRFAAIVAREWRRRGAKVRILRNSSRGNHVRAEVWLRPGRPARRQLMVLGHMDTVYPLGTLAKMPFRVSGGRAWGPGTFDMKGGLVLALFAVDALKATGIKPNKRLVFFVEFRRGNRERKLATGH
jgi:glutamate carboxypeptidase